MSRTHDETDDDVSKSEPHLGKSQPRLRVDVDGCELIRGYIMSLSHANIGDQRHC